MKRIIEFIWLEQGCDPVNWESISIGADIECHRNEMRVSQISLFII